MLSRCLQYLERFFNTLQQGKAERMDNYNYQRRSSDRIYKIRMMENIRKGIQFVGNNGPITEIVSYQNYNPTGVRIREISRLYHVAK